MFRDVIKADLDRRHEEEGPIGGPGQLVQVDESKVGRRKYNTGHLVYGNLVFGAIHPGSNQVRFYQVPNNSISIEFIEPLVRRAVAEGSLIHSDFAVCYKFLDHPDSVYFHERVNHSVEYVHTNPDGSIITTNAIEETWRPLKDFFRTRRVSSSRFPFVLKEYEWRRNVRVERKDPFLELCRAIARTKIPKVEQFAAQPVSDINIDLV